MMITMIICIPYFSDVGGISFVIITLHSSSDIIRTLTLYKLSNGRQKWKEHSILQNLSFLFEHPWSYLILLPEEENAAILQGTTIRINGRHNVWLPEQLESHWWPHYCFHSLYSRHKSMEKQLYGQGELYVGIPLSKFLIPIIVLKTD